MERCAYIALDGNRRDILDLDGMPTGDDGFEFAPNSQESVKQTWRRTGAASRGGGKLKTADHVMCGCRVRGTNDRPIRSDSYTLPDEENI